MNKNKIIKNTILLLLSEAGVFVCITCIYIGMRGILDMKTGFVASGGPYQIAHQAPEWIWIFPVSILSFFVFLGLYYAVIQKLSGVNILIFVWIFLFLSLAENFIEYSFKFIDENGINIGWLVCGIFFILLGGLPVILAIRKIYKNSNSRKNIKKESENKKIEDPRKQYIKSRTILQIFALFGGIIGGYYFFQLIS